MSDTVKLGLHLTTLLTPITEAGLGVLTLVLAPDGMWLATHDVGRTDPLSCHSFNSPAAALAELVRERGLTGPREARDG